MVKVSGSTESKQSQILNNEWLELSLAQKDMHTCLVERHRDYWPKAHFMENQKDLIISLPYEGSGNQSVLMYHAPIVRVW
jgi:hypothetical protein